MLHRQRSDKFKVEDKQVSTNGYGPEILRDTRVMRVSFAVIMTRRGEGGRGPAEPNTSNGIRVI